MVRLVRIIARTNVGGPSLQVTALMRGLDRERFDQTLLRGSCEEGESDYLELRAPDVESVLVPGMGRSVKVLGDIQALWFIFRTLRRIKPTIVHTHTAKAGTLGRLAAFLTRTPIRVHTFHGHVLHGYFGPLVTKGVVVVERVLGKMSTHLVAVGDSTLDDLVAAKIARRDRSSTVSPGVRRGETISRPVARKRLGLPSDGQVVSFVGRLTAIKRPERYVQLAYELAADFPYARFVVVGDGELRVALETDAPPNVMFLGWQGDVSTVYEASDLVVLTSDNEGMPVALIEASMHGVPCVSTDVGAVRQVVVERVTGRVVPVGDSSALADAVRELLADDQLRKRMGRAAEQHAIEHFSESRLVADYSTLYERLLASKR